MNRDITLPCEDGIVSITLFLYQNIEEKKYMVN